MKEKMKLLREAFIITAIAFGCLFGCVGAARASAKEKLPSGWKSGFVTTTDGVKIHYVEAGHVTTSGDFAIGSGSPPGISVGGSMSVSHVHQSPSILFVPGWAMPEWIWDKQIAFFSKDYHVIAMDPRCQGESSQTNDGLYPAARARDIKAAIDQLHLAPVVLVGWSMAVTEVAAYVDRFGTGNLAALVLVDGSVGGFAPGDAESDFGLLKGVLEDRPNQTDAFVRKLLFHRPQPEDYITRVIAEANKVPTASAVALLVGYFAADYRPVLPKIDKPTLVVGAKAGYAGVVFDVQKRIPNSQIEIMDDVGHALFVDDPDHFNSVLAAFLRGSVAKQAR